MRMTSCIMRIVAGISVVDISLVAFTDQSFDLLRVLDQIDVPPGEKNIQCFIRPKGYLGFAVSDRYPKLPANCHKTQHPSPR